MDSQKNSPGSQVRIRDLIGSKDIFPHCVSLNDKELFQLIDSLTCNVSDTMQIDIVDFTQMTSTQNWMPRVEISRVCVVNCLLIKLIQFLDNRTNEGCQDCSSLSHNWLNNLYSSGNSTKLAQENIGVVAAWRKNTHELEPRQAMTVWNECYKNKINPTLSYVH